MTTRKTQEFGAPATPGEEEMTRLELYRRSSKWTQRRLAEHAGVSQALISRIETGRLRPTVKSNERFNTAFATPGWVDFGEKVRVIWKQEETAATAEGRRRS